MTSSQDARTNLDLLASQSTSSALKGKSLYVHTVYDESDLFNAFQELFHVTSINTFSKNDFQQPGGTVMCV